MNKESFDSSEKLVLSLFDVFKDIDNEELVKEKEELFERKKIILSKKIDKRCKSSSELNMNNNM